MKYGDTSRTAIKYSAATLLSFVLGRLSTQLVGSLFEWPRAPVWMNVNTVGVAVNGVVAAGTCAAVIVALRLAGRQNQQKLQDELNRAKLSAVGATFRLGAARGYVMGAIEEIESLSRSKLSRDSMAKNVQLSKIVQLLKGGDIFDWTEIHNLAALPGDTAIILACAKDRIHLVIAAIESEINHPGTGIPFDEDYWSDLHAALQDVERWLFKAMDICDTQTKGFAPNDQSIEIADRPPTE